MLGTAGYSSPKILLNSIINACAEIVTLGLKRQIIYEQNKNNVWIDAVKSSGCKILPNTAGCRTAKEAVVLAQMSRELFETNWVKLEVIGDEYTLGLGYRLKDVRFRTSFGGKKITLKDKSDPSNCSVYNLMEVGNTRYRNAKLTFVEVKEIKEIRKQQVML